MYNISDVVEMGNAHEHILTLIKDLFSIDDAEPQTLSEDEAFDE